MMKSKQKLKKMSDFSMYIFCDWSFQPKRRASPNVLMQEYSWNIWGKAGKLMWLVKGEQKKSIKERSDKDKWELDPMESHWPSKGLHMLSKMRIFCSVWNGITWSDLCSNRIILAANKKEGYCGSGMNSGQEESDSRYILEINSTVTPNRQDAELWEKGQSQRTFQTIWPE